MRSVVENTPFSGWHAVWESCIWRRFYSGKKRIDVNSNCGTGTLPLHVSITAGNINVVELLLAQ